jgi:hypothetical protein
MAEEDTVNLVSRQILALLLTRVMSKHQPKRIPPLSRNTSMQLAQIHHDSPMDGSSLAPGGWTSFV